MTATMLPGRAEWLAWRREGIGGSDVAGILGLSPWSSPWAVWADKVGLLPLDTEQSEAMEFGKRVEPMLADWFRDETGLSVVSEQQRCTHPEQAWQRCTIDGVAASPPDPDGADAVPLGVVEFKATGQAPWDEVPAHYRAQVLWQCHVTGLDRGWLAVLHIAFGRPTFRVYDVIPDIADMELLVGTVERFWSEHVVTGAPPEIDASPGTWDALAAAWPEHAPGETAEVDLDDVTVRAGLKDDAKELQDHIRLVEARLAAALGDAETGCVDDQPVITYRAQTRKTTCSECGHVSESRPFRVFRPVTTKEARHG